MKLYRVVVEFDLFVVADSESEAEAIAESAVRHDDVEPDYLSAKHIEGLREVPFEWTGDVLPYGENQGLSCEQWVEAQDGDE